MEALLLPGLVVLAVLAGGTGVWRGRRRDQALQALARQQGWDLVLRDDTWADAFEGEPFGRGRGRRAEHVLTGTYGGRDLVAFDYSFRTSSTDGNGQRQSRTHRYDVAVLRLPAAVPLVEVKASAWSGLLPRVFGRRLELESEDFNARYRVRADEPRLAYDVLPPRTMQLLLERPDVSLRLLGGVALTWDKGRLDPTELLVRLDTMTAVLDGVPDWVWRDRT